MTASQHALFASFPTTGGSLVVPLLLLIAFSIQFQTSLAIVDGMTLRIDAGKLTKPDGKPQEVGFYASTIQKVVDSMYPEVNEADISKITYFNASNLRYLLLSGGEYLVDEPLLLPSMFVLSLEKGTSMALAPNATAAPTSSDDDSSLPSLVGLVDVSFSAVIGGTFDARGHEDGWECIRILNGAHNSIRNVKAISHVNEAWKSTVTIRGGSRHELAKSTVDGEDVAGRCVWTIATSAALIHDNIITRCVGHALDFDAYTSGSTAYSNVVEYNTGGEYGQGIFVEETASGNFIFNNSVSHNTNGIELYSLTVGPVTGNIIANNRVVKNLKKGISSGGGNADASNHADSNIFVGNKASGNGEGDLWVNHGHIQNDFWVSNEGEWVMDGGDLMSSKNVSVFDP
ncbi:hypothetical protein TrCOL_g2220 [Triparma columacea]|uniref:Right handed beta helix domain-containing protein n=1 Tax=Triparma columacea TaxID=722753 RepID=A0A9W7G3C5_9STRA|nr:hypothetical protein TrCOL_g2220 [Triparma columacea]